MTEYYLIGRIESPAGSNGFVKISLQSDFPDRFNILEEAYIDFWGDKKKFIIEKVSKQKNNILLKFKSFDSLREVQLLAGRDLFVAEDKVVRLPEHNFFIHDIVGSKVFLNNEFFGEITDVGRTKANDIIAIRKTDNKEILLPLIDSFIEKFDVDKKIMLLKNDIDLSDDED